MSSGGEQPRLTHGDGESQAGRGKRGKGVASVEKNKEDGEDEEAG